MMFPRLEANNGTRWHEQSKSLCASDSESKALVAQNLIFQPILLLEVRDLRIALETYAYKISF